MPRVPPVTIADRLAESEMRAVLARRRPDDAILGEEYGHKSGTSGLIDILQTTSGAYANVAQSGGADNDAFVTQASLGAVSYITQVGSLNVATVNQ